MFTHTLPTVLRAFGADPIAAERVSDDADATATVLDAAQERIVVTTGGTAGSSRTTSAARSPGSAPSC